MCGDTPLACRSGAPVTRARAEEEDEALRAGGDTRCAV